MINFFTIIAEQALIYMPLLFGAYISFSLMKTPDLSIESAYLFGALCAGKTLAITGGYPLPLVLVLTLVASMLGGLCVGITSSCITYFGNIPHLLSSIITFGLFHGLFQLLSSPYQSLASYNNPLLVLPSMQTHPELTMLAIITLVLSIGFAYFLQTQLGHSLVIFGDAPQFFKHLNIATGYVFITGIALANSLAGLAGYLFAQTNNLIEINMGIGKTLFCITTLILGKTLLGKKRASIAVPIAGLCIYFTLQQLLLKSGFNLKYFTAAQALLILVILIIMRKQKNKTIDQLGV